MCDKSYMSPRPPPKISLRHDHDWTRGNDDLGSTVEQQPVGKIVQQSRGEVQHATFSQLTQPIPKPICDRSGKLDSRGDFDVTSHHSQSVFVDLPASLPSGALSATSSGLSFLVVIVVSLMTRQQPCLKTSEICFRPSLLWTLWKVEDVFVVKGETSRSHEIDEKVLHEELVSSDRSGKPDNLFETTRVEQTRWIRAT